MKIRMDLKILFFLALFYFLHRIKLYFIIMFFCFIHELAHLFVGLFLGFKAQEFEIMPFGFFIRLKSNIKDYNKKILKSNVSEIKKVLVILAGPITNLIFIIIFTKLNSLKYQIYIYANLIILLLNLIPIYPLDGGRCIKSLLKILLGVKRASKYSNVISNVFMILFTMMISVLILYLKNIFIVFILMYLWYLTIKENKKYEIQKKVYNLFE